MSGKQRFWHVEDRWPGATVALLGGGPSLSAAQVERLRGRVRVIAINDALRLAPWADIHYFCDDRWWRWHAADDWVRDYRGIRVTLENPVICERHPEIRALRNYGWDPKIGHAGLCPHRDGTFTGLNGGFQSLTLAVHLGAKRIVLLGFDMRVVNGRSHWFGEHPDRSGASAYREMRACFDTLPAGLAKRGVEVINCTPQSALQAFPRADLESVLPDPQPAALPA